MRKHLRTVFVAVLIALIGWGGAARAADAPLPVVASFSVLGDMVKQVGGDAVDVKTLVVPDNDTHAYQPTPEDAKTLVGAKLIFVNGLGFEGWRERLVSASGTKAQLIIASAGVKSRTMIEDATEADGTSSP